MMPRPGFPKADAVLLRRRSQKIVDLFVLIYSPHEILLGSHLGTDQMITMNRTRNRNLFLSRLHELQHGHLRSCILHRHAIRTEKQHGLATLPDLRIKVVGMRNQDLLSQRQRAPEFLPGLGDHVRHFGIQLFGYLKRHGKPSFKV